MSAKKTAAKTAAKSARKTKAPAAQPQTQAPQPASESPEAAAQAPEPASPAPEQAAGGAEPRGARTLTGRVVSSKMQKTIAVEIERRGRHPAYGKSIRRTTRLLAHAEDGSCREGDLVTITPCRPLSRHK